MHTSNLLVFGGTGFIGTQLLSRLVTETFAAPGLPEGRVIVPLDSADAATRRRYSDYAASRHEHA